MKNKIRNIFLLIFSLLLLYIIIESVSFLFLKYSKNLQFTYPYFNQQISPYYVFGNTPGYKYQNCIKSTSQESDVVIDQYGFISSSQIEKQKDTNTIRIFITGGSGAFGSGQISSYKHIKSYPGGIYTFESSIAGQLQKKLIKNFPNKKIEVINACAVKRMLHQSVSYYLETISEFSPSIIISLDGNNDIAPICGFSPYIKGSLDFSTYIELYEIKKQNQIKRFSNLANLINKLKISNIKNKKDIEVDYFRYSFDSITFKDYLIYKKRFIKGSEKFINLIKYYHSICETDKVDFIFCLQPLLYRQRYNKKLSISEHQMQSKFFNPSSKEINANEIVTHSQIELIMKGSNLILKYFVDDYLTDKISEISIADNFYYIDMNKEIMNVSSNKDVFVDYCHLTPEGNEIVAEILFEKITSILNRKNKPNKKYYLVNP